eukprot:10387430-Alexandrium_andersonii.AAC.1
MQKTTRAQRTHCGMRCKSATGNHGLVLPSKSVEGSGSLRDLGVSEEVVHEVQSHPWSLALSR